MLMLVVMPFLTIGSVPVTTCTEINSNRNQLCDSFKTRNKQFKIKNGRLTVNLTGVPVAALPDDDNPATTPFM